MKYASGKGLLTPSNIKFKQEESKMNSRIFKRSNNMLIYKKTIDIVY